MGFFCDTCGALLPPKTEEGQCTQCRKINNTKRIHQQKTFFPFPKIRGGQKEFMEDAERILHEGKILIAHAPTGIGKTAAVLSAAFKARASQKIFFLTSKQSQHRIAIDTLQRMPGHIHAIDVISKQHMCPLDTSHLPYPVFEKFCNEKGQAYCNLFNQKMSRVITHLRKSTRHVEDIITMCRSQGVCPHKAALMAARETDFLICDYNYIFSDIRDHIFDTLEIDLEDIIIIVDEAHNLPERVRSHLEENISLPTLNDAFLLLKKQKSPHAGFVKRLSVELEHIKGGERRITKQFLDTRIQKAQQGTLRGYTTGDSLLSDLEDAAREILEQDPTAIAPLQLFSFLSTWNVEGQEVFRSFTPNPPRLKIALLDPGIYTREVFHRVSGAVLMSGTLHPGKMYGDILGIDNPVIKTYVSPFPKENRKIVSVPHLTTRYEERGSTMYLAYANTICDIANITLGNVAAFFPSYELLNLVAEQVCKIHLEKEVIIEKRGSSKWEKQKLLTVLKQGDNYLLMGVQGGSLSEGTDYENNSLSSIIIAGMPFPPPSLEMQALQEFYSQKFGETKGYEYSCVYPSLNRVFQAVGRCIRSETDRGFIVLMDKRFQYPRYKNMMPQGFQYCLTNNVTDDCKEFFT